MDARPDSEPREPPHRLLPWLVAIGFFMQILDTTLVNAALPTMSRALGESPLRLQAVVLVYLLMVALLTPASGWLADRFGTRTVYQLAIVLFALGALSCALSQTLSGLLWSRALQGAGGALLLPVGRLALLRVYPPAQLIGVLALVTLPGMIGPLAGPVVGGWLVENLDWHAVFLLHVPVAALGLLATARWMPQHRGAPGRFDLLGFALFGSGIVLLTWGLQGLGLRSLGGGTAWPLARLAAGALLMVLYFRHARRAEAPLFATRLTRLPAFRLAILGNLAARISMGAMPLMMPLFLQLGLGRSPVAAGLMSAPVALGAMCSKALVERVIHRFGFRLVLVVNSLALGALTAAFAFVGPDTPLWLFLGHLAVFGVSTSLQFTGMNSLTLSDLQGEHASGGNSLFSVVVQVSMGLGVAVAGLLMGLFGGFAPGAGSAQLMYTFHASFAVLGLSGVAAAMVFLRVQPDKGVHLPAAAGGTA